MYTKEKDTQHRHEYENSRLDPHLTYNSGTRFILILNLS